MKLSIDGNLYDSESFIFSGGEVQVKIPLVRDDFYNQIGAYRITIRADLINSDRIMELFMLTDALRRQYPNARSDLICPYFPYARQDRVMNNGEALAVRVMATLINEQRYDSVEIWDAHSDVTLALLDRVDNIGQEKFVQHLYVTGTIGFNNVLVAPDAGAMKKITSVSKLTGLSMVRADKTRDVKTGEITGTVVYSDPIGDKDFLIVDDICDGGRTFIELAKVLRPLTEGKVKLYVTHGIFSKGLEVFDGLIDEIYCANIWPNVVDDKNILRKVTL